MRRFIILLILATIVGCSTTTKVGDKKEPKVVLHETTDTTEYELLVLDTDFESWFMTRKREGYRSHHYYRNWNLRYVTDWNSRYYSGFNHDYFEMPIEYDPFVDYGFELDEKLYHYFVFVEQKLKIPILYGQPRQNY